MTDIKWPTTLRGWKTLFWLAIHRCPIHRSRLQVDATIYDMNGPGYCFDCYGVGIWPRSAAEALRQNKKASDARASQTEEG